MIVVEPHTFGSPAPPHDSPLGQGAPVPHVTVPPQPSAITPQFIGMPDEVTQTEPAVAGIHAALPPHTFGVPPPPQVAGGVNVAHEDAMRPPHPSACWPQREETLGSLHVFGTHGAAPPQTLGVPPPPHDWPAGQLAPHCMTPPQPSATSPQFAPACAQVRGVQPPEVPVEPSESGTRFPGDVASKGSPPSPAAPLKPPVPPLLPQPLPRRPIAPAKSAVQSRRIYLPRACGLYAQHNAGADSCSRRDVVEIVTAAGAQRKPSGA
jgi:hypothetical protein